jgi:hypothetical protein
MSLPKEREKRTVEIDGTIDSIEKIIFFSYKIKRKKFLYFNLAFGEKKHIYL